MSEVSTVSNIVGLQKCLALAGWEILHIDLDLTREQPRVEIRLERQDGLWLLARVDSLGRASIETFMRERKLDMSANTKGRRPLSPQVTDIWLGRQTCLGARHMLKTLSYYISDNSVKSVARKDIKQAWAAVMAAPLLFQR